MMLKYYFAVILLFPLLSFHPLHLSYTNLEYVSVEKHWIMSIRLFSDDFLDELSENYGLVRVPDQVMVEIKDSSAITKFVCSELELKFDQKPIEQSSLIFKGLHYQEDATWLDYQIDYAQVPGVFTIKNRFFFKRFPDQRNLMIITVEDVQKALQFNHRKDFFKLSM